MRITNKIMQNNSMYNINNNKIREDDMGTQMATGKKISRPSDDPVIAIRALRLRSTVSQIDQYYEKNSEDANSWLQVTEDSLTTITDVLTDAKKLANQGANKDLTIDDLNTIVTQLQELSNEYYSTGNVDFANRYIFTGYRTNTPLSYDGKTTARYEDINDEFNGADVGTAKRVVNLQDLSAETVLQAGSDTTEIDVQEYEVGRIRLSYDNLDYEDYHVIRIFGDDFDLNIPMKLGGTARSGDYTVEVVGSDSADYQYKAVLKDPKGNESTLVYYNQKTRKIGSVNGSGIGAITEFKPYDKADAHKITFDEKEFTVVAGTRANDPKLLFRENLNQPATSTISNTQLQVVNLTFQDNDGVVHKACIPAAETSAEDAGMVNATYANGREVTRTKYELSGGNIVKNGEYTVQDHAITSKDAYSVTITNDLGTITYTTVANYRKNGTATELSGYTVRAVEVPNNETDPDKCNYYEFALTKDGVIDIDTDTESPLYGEMVLERWGEPDVKITDNLYGKPKLYVNQAYVDAYTEEPDASGNRKVKAGVTKEDCLDKRIVKEGITTVTTDNKESTALFSDNYDNSEVTIPLLKSQDQQYTIDVIYHNGKKYSEAAPDTPYNFKATVNSDNTYTIENSNQYTDPTTGKVVNADAKFDKDTDALQTTFIQMTENGSISSSYTENALTIDGQHIIYRTTPQGNKEANSARSKELEEDDVAGVPNVDWVYQKLDQKKDEIMVVDAGDQAQDILYLNADTGEVLMSQALKDRLASLKTVLNANTIDVVYDKKEWTEGDIQPQHLFKCTYVGSDGSDDTIKEMDGKIREHDVLYNGGFRGHDIQYDVGYNQRITVNTTADTVFTADVKRDVDDLSNIMDQLNQVNTAINTLKEKLASTTDPDDKNTIQNEINAAQKAYDYLRTDLQKEFEHKITSMSEALDAANVAVTQNGTRSRRLELIQTRLQNQQTTFKTLQSNNEDADIAETATGLTTAQTTYQASLIATGKISQTSLMDYI